MLKTYSFASTEAGPHLLVLGGVHGNESCGVIAINKMCHLMKTGALSLQCGTVTFVPCCNEKAFAQQTRYVDENLNRCIDHHAQPSTYEQSVANELIKLIDVCDIMIDLHSATSTPCAFTFLDHDTAAGRQLVAAMGLETILVDWPKLYPQATDSSTQTYADRMGKLSLTIECGQHDDPAAADYAYQTMINAFQALSMILPTQAQPVVIPHYLRMTDVFYQKNDQRLTKPYQSFQPIAENEIIAQNATGQHMLSPHDGFIIMPNAEAPEGEELFYIAIKA